MEVLSRNWGMAAANASFEKQPDGSQKLWLDGFCWDGDLRRYFHPAKGFDGLERYFAMAPTPSGEWKRFDLTYRRTEGLRDLHSKSVTAAEVDFAAARRDGVAFGMETNTGTIYLQHFRANAKPLEDGRPWEIAAAHLRST